MEIMFILNFGFCFIFQVIRSSGSDVASQFLILLSCAAQKLKIYLIKYLSYGFFPLLTYHRYAHDCDSDHSTWYGLKLYRESDERGSWILELFNLNSVKIRSFIELTLTVSFAGNAINRFVVHQWVFDFLW